ncbi:methyl-accepting chemotaxis protein [Lonsdalea quercina]|uniref:methyl-accepting chemotaxis protein n=1 Tax=Lonsdalea quercina TaxID=71657 RepID=UPI003975E1CF
MAARLSQRIGLLRTLSQFRPSFLSGLIFIIGLFSILQLLSIGALSQTVTQVKQGSHTQAVQGQQQALMDQTRMEIMNASDKLNRAGIYLLNDKESGSVGSWQSLMEEAETSLKLAKSHYQQLLSVVPSDQRDTAFSELTAHYQQLYDGLVELAQGIKQTNEIDIFFAVPIQAYQNMFTQSYARYLKDSDRRQQQTSLRLISQLDRTQTVFVAVLAALLVIAALVWIGATRLFVRPLSHIHQHLQRIAAGDLSQPLTQNDRTAREVHQLSQSITVMQSGLVTLVGQVREGMETMLAHVAKANDDNQKLSIQAEYQFKALSAATEHVEELNQYLENHERQTQQASRHAEETSHIAGKGEKMMSDVKDAMRAISERSQQMTDVISLIDNVAFQTHILSLNAAIEAARAGVQGRGFAVVAREIGTLASQSSHSAQNINALISQSDQSVASGAQRVNQLNDSLQNILCAARETSAFLNEITAIAQQQNHSIHQVTHRIGSLNESVKQNAGQVTASAHTFSLLLQQAAQLNSAVSLFLLPESSRNEDGASVPIAPLSSSTVEIPSRASVKIDNDASKLRLKGGVVSVKKPIASVDYHS